MVVGRVVCFLREKAGYEMRISDWSSDVCASDRQRRLDLLGGGDHQLGRGRCPVATGMAVEQRRAQYGLQRRDAAGHRGMVDLQAACRGRQAAVARQRQHVAQVIPVEPVICAKMLSHRAILWNSHRARHGLNRGCHTNRSIAMTRPKTLLEMAGAAGQPVLWDKSVLLLIDNQVEYTAAGGLPLTDRKSGVEGKRRCVR